jgi:hypothetical protein
MLFLLGHGVVVGNDIFMLDEHASEQSLTLTDLGQIIGEFKHSIELEGSVLDLISFHSCSVSALEVAYELQDTAKYMLASQGPAYVGSWPYRQILIRIFNSLEDKKTPINMRELMFEIYRSCMRNSADFLLAGYSFQLTLCDLEKITNLQKEIDELARALTAGLNKDLSRDYILLSHWKSQSFFNEMYTDLYDFCFCLSNKINDLSKGGDKLSQEIIDIQTACGKLMDKLVKENPKKEGDPDIEQIIVAADSLGPAFQYSRGLSVYFPWAEPSKESPIMAQYERYRFTTEIKNSWLSFLRAYFEKTKRVVSSAEVDNRRYLPHLPANGPVPLEQSLDVDIASLIYNGEGVPDLRGALGRGDKTDPTDKTGGDYDAVSIKNFPRDIRTRGERMRQGFATFPIFEAFGLIDKNSKNGAYGPSVCGSNVSSQSVTVQNGQNGKS